MSEKLKIFNRDGTITEVEPLNAWNPGDFFEGQSETYKPRKYKHLSSARRAGLRECMKRSIGSYRVITLDTFYLAVGNEELKKFKDWINKHEIPVNWSKDCEVNFVWDAIQ